LITKLPEVTELVFLPKTSHHSKTTAVTRRVESVAVLCATQST